ncbi:MAG TPA: rhomboid family protein [Phycisphaerae bacterium]|nr:rhomboid family protein [Phycisphaerae bacterium]
MPFQTADNQSLSAKRCFHHAQREAAARCPHCRRYFCRECVTEHEGRLTCAQCLRRIAEAEQARRRRTLGAVGALVAMVGVVVAWGAFLLLGRLLLSLPDEFHQGSMWLK